MDNHYSLHAGTINPVKMTGSGMQFHDSGSLVLLRARHNNAIRAISSSGEFWSNPTDHFGESVMQIKQGSGKDKAIHATVVGYVDSNGNCFGEVPNKTVQFFVYK